MIAVIDYGVGNVGSIRNMLKKLGIEAEVTGDASRIAADKLILPGVGAFDAGMARLRHSGLVPLIEQRVLRDNVPVLGICLGMQLMTRQSSEGRQAGLGWIDAETVRFVPSDDAPKVPHMGWNRVLATRPAPLIEALPPQPRFYFVHSYYVRCARSEDVLLTTDYGGSFASAFQRGNIGGVQFHPEKSHKFGMCACSAISRGVVDNMLSTRVIPCLLLRGAGLVKTVRFKDSKYVGDPINAIRIFNDKEVDELVLLDIDASKTGREPSFELIEEIAAECFMPLAYGGGVRSLEDARRIFKLGIEKIVLNTIAWREPDVLREIAREFGAQAVVASIDVKRSMLRGTQVWVESASKSAGVAPVEYAQRMQELGAGEILLTSVDRDGTMKGFDLQLVAEVSAAVDIPVIASGGAGSIDDLAAAVQVGGADAVAAGSMFVFHGPHRAVLITYPERQRLERALQTAAA